MKQPYFDRQKNSTNQKKILKHKLLKKLNHIREKYADHKYLENMLKREIYDPEYHVINIKYQNTIVCYYCGMPATGYDHVPPLSKCDDYVIRCKQQDVKPQLLKLSCCGECNILLGPTHTRNLEERLKLLRQRIRRKYSETTPESNRVLYGRVLRRITFERGINRTRGRYE